jgi:hypothetical protein
MSVDDGRIIVMVVMVGRGVYGNENTNCYEYFFSSSSIEENNVKRD